MRIGRFVVFVSFLFIALSVVGRSAPVGDCASSDAIYYPDQVLVVFCDGISGKEQMKILKKYGRDVTLFGVLNHYGVVKKLKHRRSVEVVIDLLKKEKGIKISQPNYRYHANEQQSGQE